MTLRSTRLALLFVASTVSSLAGHHALTDTYDTTTTVALTGVILKVEVKNPHATLELQSRDARGGIITWVIELAPPAALQRRGVTLEVGQQVVVESWLRKDGGFEATGRTIVTADQQRIDVADAMNWGPSMPARR